MSQDTELIEALKEISRDKGIDQAVIFEAIETSLVTACKKNFSAASDIKVVIDRETGQVLVYLQKTVVEKVLDPNAEISVDDARKINVRYGVGDIVDVAVTPRNFLRVSAQTAKQVVVQKFREAEREILYNEFITKEKDVVTGLVQRRDRKNIVISLGRLDAVLGPSDQMPNEEYNFQDRLKVYVTEVKQTPKGPQVSVSRTHPELVKRLFEQEVPEVYEGLVEIKSISREAGSRTKVAVFSRNPNIDPVGACVGQNGYRVNVVVDELNGEKIDVVQWSRIPEKYIAAALSPSDVLAVVVTPETQSARIVVPDYQLSLAIGKAGQNAKLAAKLTGWRIDIKSETQARAMEFIPDEAYDEFIALYNEGAEDL
jgi:N utilization substance protein A